MKKNSLIVGLVIIFISLIIGGVLMFNSQEKQREQNYRREQDRMVKYLVSNYEEINKVEFTEIDYNEVAGTYSFYAIINDKITVDFTLWKLGGEIDMSELSSRNSGNYLEKMKKSGEKSRISDVQIIYMEK
ncbi:hypothetical protein ACM0P9_03930 [Streptococcus pluranimalium]